MKLVIKHRFVKRYRLLVKQDMQLLHLVQKQCIYLVTFQSTIFTLRRNCICHRGRKSARTTEVDEQYLLDVEREAFISLVSEMKSQARMQHMLVKESHYVTNNEGDIVHERSCHCCGSKNTN